MYIVQSYYVTETFGLAILRKLLFLYHKLLMVLRYHYHQPKN